MSELVDVARVLHTFNVGRAMRKQIIEDNRMAEQDAMMIMSPMDIERSIAREIANRNASLADVSHKEMKDNV